MNARVSRREMLRLAGVAGMGAVLAACAPRVVEKVVEKEVTRQVEVEKVVKETFQVEKVVQQTVVVEKQVMVAAPKGKPVLRFTTDWYGGARGDLTNLFLAEWKDNVNPEVSIAYEPCPRVQDRLRVDFAAGTPPDVMLFAPELYASFGEQLLVLDDFWAQADPKWKDDTLGWDPSFRYEGKLVAVPFQHNIWAPMINVDLFEQAGVPMPWEYSHKDKWWDWDDLVETCRAIDELGDDIYGYDLGGNSTYMQWGPWIMTNGGQYVDPEWPEFGQTVKSTLDTPAATEAITFVASMHCDTKVAIPIETARTMQTSLNVSPFFAGKVGVAQTTSEGGIRNAKMNAHRVVMPRSPKTGTGCQHQGNCPHVAYQKTQYPQECWDFMAFLDGTWAQKENGMRGGAMPGLKSVLADPDYYADFPAIAREALLTSADENKCLPGGFINFEEWRKDVEAIAMDMLLCNIPAAQAIAEMQETGSAILARKA